MIFITAFVACAVILAAGLFFIRWGCQLTAGFWPSWSAAAKAMGLCTVAALPITATMGIPAVADNLGAVLALAALLLLICAWALGAMLTHPKTGSLGIKKGGVISLVWGAGGFVVVSLVGVVLAMLIPPSARDRGASAEAAAPSEKPNYFDQFDPSPAKPTAARDSNFATCLLDKLPVVQNDVAANAAFQACASAYPGGLSAVSQGAGRGWASQYDSGVECTLRKAGDSRSNRAASLIEMACRRLYDEPAIDWSQYELVKPAPPMSIDEFLGSKPPSSK